MEALIDTRLRTSLQMHDVLHGFRFIIRTGKAIMELNLAQEIASIEQDPLFLVFLDLRKAYDTVDQDRLLIKLKGYGAGLCMCGILETFWDCQQVVTRQNGFHRLTFSATMGTMQGELMSPTLFNIVVDNVIRN